MSADPGLRPGRLLASATGSSPDASPSPDTDPLPSLFPDTDPFPDVSPSPDASPFPFPFPDAGSFPDPFPDPFPDLFPDKGPFPDGVLATGSLMREWRPRGAAGRRPAPPRGRRSARSGWPPCAC
ncbi:hypothetical protein GCM10018952_12950 [Streptosporangium vulgare]